MSAAIEVQVVVVAAAGDVVDFGRRAIVSLKRRSVVGLGANLGDRIAALQAAVKEIDRALSVDATSRVYATAPVGGPPQGEFLNAAVLLHLGLGASPSDLMAVLVEI